MTKRKNNSGDAAWLVDQARSYIVNGQPYAAKTWLLTAKTLYPSNFSIQYEEFIMERKAAKVQKCGKLFYDMMSQFSNEQILWDELSRIFHAQDTSRTQNSESKFLKEMFDSLPKSHQKELLLKYANHQHDLIDKCQISMLVLKRFEGAIRDQAVNLITTLKAAEDKECGGNPLNIYRKLIVCDILPLVLRSPATQLSQQAQKFKSSTLFVSEAQLIYYLNLVMEFYVMYAIDRSSLRKSYDSSMNNPDVSTLSLDETISCWHQLHEHLVLFAGKCGWSNFNKFKDKIDPGKNRPLKSRWKTLNNARDTKPHLAIFYSLLQLHIFTVLEYCSSINTESGKISSPKPDQSENEFILVENIDPMSQRESSHQGVIRTPKKKKKSDDSGRESSDYQSSSEDVKVIVHPGLIGQVSEGLGDCVQVAIDTQNLLKSMFYSEFYQIEKDWHMRHWSWMKTFEVDALMYQGKYRAAIEKLSSEENKMSDEIHLYSLKRSLQLSSALFCSGQRKAACEKALDTVALLSQSSIQSISNVEEKKIAKPEGRSLLLLSSSSADVLTYAVQITFAALKTRLYCDGPQRDAVIGHLIVLSQLTWSTNEEFFLHLLKLIQAQDDGFTYDLFFDYVTQIDILEEFAFLHSIDSVPLQLLPTDDSKYKKTVTRGVNRGALDDFKTHIERQVQRSGEPIRSVIYEFLCQEKEAILDAL